MKIRPVLTLVCVGLGAAAAVTANLEQEGPTAIKEKRDESVWDRALLEQRQNLELSKRDAQGQNWDVVPRHSDGHIAVDKRDVQDDSAYYKRDILSDSHWDKRSAFSLPGVPGKFRLALLARRGEDSYIGPGSPIKRDSSGGEDSYIGPGSPIKRDSSGGEDPYIGPGFTERRNKDWRRAYIAADGVEKRGELSARSVKPREAADSDASPDGKGVTRRDDANPDGKGVTRRDGGIPDGKGATKRDDVNLDGKGVTRRDGGIPDGKGATKRDGGIPDGKGATKRDDANPDGKGATKRDADVDSDGNTLDWAGPTRRGKRDSAEDTADWAGPTRRGKRDNDEDTANWAGPT